MLDRTGSLALEALVQQLSFPARDLPAHAPLAGDRLLRDDGARLALVASSGTWSLSAVVLDGRNLQSNCESEVAPVMTDFLETCVSDH